MRVFSTQLSKLLYLQYLWQSFARLYIFLQLLIRFHSTLGTRKGFRFLIGLMRWKFIRQTESTTYYQDPIRASTGVAAVKIFVVNATNRFCQISSANKKIYHDHCIILIQTHVLLHGWNIIHVLCISIWYYKMSLTHINIRVWKLSSCIHMGWCNVISCKCPFLKFVCLGIYSMDELLHPTEY